MNILWCLHLLIPFSILIMPFLPVAVLSKILWYPLIYDVGGILFDGCPCTKWTASNEGKKTEDARFIHPIFNSISKKLFCKEISPLQSDHIQNLLVGICIVVSAYRVIWSINSKLYTL